MENGQQTLPTASAQPANIAINCEDIDLASARDKRRGVAGGAVGVAALCALFTALYWNTFLAVSAGGTFFYLGEQILKGRLPYRDLFFVVTPLQALKISAMISLFGDRILWVRLESAIERVLLGLLLYFLVVRFCRASSALLASVLTIVVLASDPGDALINYHIDSVFWAVVATLCASLRLTSGHAGRKIALAAACGFGCALCVLTKQTTGLGVTAALAITSSIVLLRSEGRRGSLRFVLEFAAGWLVPMTAFAIWLSSTNALRGFLDTVFLTQTSKGTIWWVLVRPVMQVPSFFLLAAVAAPGLAWLTLRLPVGARRDSARRVWVIGLVSALTLALTAAFIYSGVAWPGANAASLDRQTSTGPALHPLTALRIVSENLVIPMTLAGSAVLYLICLARYWKRELSIREAQIWVISGASFAVAYMLSLSWAIYSPMVAPGLALISALTLDRFEGRGGKWFPALAGVVLFLIYLSAGGKLAQPFYWMHWPEPPVSEPRRASVLPKLAGLEIPEETAALTESITHLVLEHTSPGDSLLVYPYFPLFYVLTDLNPPTYGFNHFLDVCPDSICKQDAAKLLAHPPDAMIYMVEDDAVLARDEKVFRGGGKSGSRQMAEAIEQLASGYRKLLSAKVPGSNRTIEVYSKR